jgi:DNA-binding CsgD family transcriptional regulator
MQLIRLDSQDRACEHPVGTTPYEAITGMISLIGSRDFANGALAQLNRWMPLCWWSVYRLFDDQPPTMYTSGSYGVADGTQDSWRVYRASLYRRDETFAAAREQTREGRSVLLHWHAKEIPLVHRQRIYSRHGLRERLSIVSSDAARALLAVNFYRHEEQPAFVDDEIDSMQRVAPLILSCVERHLSIGTDVPPSDMLKQLTPREREVCERLLKGWTHDGIGADLGVSAATVKTYRDRAFERLGIHHRNELFALIFGRLA